MTSKTVKTVKAFNIKTMTVIELVTARNAADAQGNDKVSEMFTRELIKRDRRGF